MGPQSMSVEMRIAFCAAADKNFICGLIIHTTNALHIPRNGCACDRPSLGPRCDHCNWAVWTWAGPDHCPRIFPNSSASRRTSCCGGLHRRLQSSGETVPHGRTNWSCPLCMNYCCRRLGCNPKMHFLDDNHDHRAFWSKIRIFIFGRTDEPKKG